LKQVTIETCHNVKNYKITVIASLKHAKIVNKNNNMGKFKLNFKSSKRKELQNKHKKKKK
jgi:hypothetical protein